MEIREISIPPDGGKQIWEDFVSSCEEKSFLQSWNWGEFQKMMGNKIWKFGIYNNELESVALVVKNVARRGTFLLVPHGPIVKSDNYKKEVLKLLVDKLKEISKEEKASFIRIAPIWQRSKENIDIFKDLGFINSAMLIHLEATWQLDITKPEEELLKDMRKTTRYLIRQAEKNKDIKITLSKDLRDIGTLSDIHNKVSMRQKFVPFSYTFLKNEFLAFKDDDKISIFSAKYKGETIGSALIVFDAKKGFYHHSAVLAEYMKLPAMYLLLWEAIKEAKKRGCSVFDFWGYVDPKSKHPWAGPTLFKMGFGGEKQEFVKNMDLPIAKTYWLTYIFEKLRKIKRGL